MRQSSIDAFHNLNRHRENSKAYKIIQAITTSEIPLNDRRIAVKTGIPVNEVESIVCKLECKGEIVRLPDVLDCKTGNFSRVWIVKPFVNPDPDDNRVFSEEGSV